MRQVYLWDDTSGMMQQLYVDRTANCLRPNLTFVSHDGSVVFETNEIGLKGDPVDPTRQLAVVWGDSVVFGKVHGWPCLLDAMVPGFQFLNGGIEGTHYYEVLERAIRMNQQVQIALNVILPGWHPMFTNDGFETQMTDALDNIPNAVLATMPTALNRSMIENDISELLTGYGAGTDYELKDKLSFGFYGLEYSVAEQKRQFDHIIERNAIIKQVAAAKGLPVIDLFTQMDSGWLADFRQEFLDPWHPRVSAYPKIAHAVYDGIKHLVKA